LKTFFSLSNTLRNGFTGLSERSEMPGKFFSNLLYVVYQGNDPKQISCVSLK